MDLKKSIMFMAHIPLKDISNVVTTLLGYSSVKRYMVCGEDKPYEHIHFLVEMSKTDYSAYAKRVFIDKYKLRGRAKKDLCRQYGKVKKIDDIYGAMCYTLKEGNEKMRYTNLDPKIIKKLLEDSFKKEEIDKLYECMKTTTPDIHCTAHQYEKVLTSQEKIDCYGNENEYFENIQKYELPQGYTLGNFGNLRLNLRFYLAKVFETIGPVKNMRTRFLKACLDLKYLSTTDYVQIVYRL
jgi:hypothetical protein